MQECSKKPQITRDTCVETLGSSTLGVSTFPSVQSLEAGMPLQENTLHAECSTPLGWSTLTSHQGCTTVSKGVQGTLHETNPLPLLHLITLPSVPEKILLTEVKPPASQCNVLPVQDE